jgi:competence protein ComGC
VICGHKALGHIKRSGGALQGQGLAIAGLVTGYVSILLSLVMIPMMLAIAIPNFVRAREAAQANACRQNLKMLETAKDMWALETKQQPTATPTMNNLQGYLNRTLTCPAGGTYTVNQVDQAPTCSIPGHNP